MEASFLTRHPGLRDALGFVGFVVLVLIGTLFINSFVFRSFNVVGQSMENTLHTGDRLIINRLPVTMANIQNKSYVPERGQIIVFKNPRFTMGNKDEFIIKRVIAFPGEKVTVRSGKLTVYNNAHPEGFNPDELPSGGTPGSYSSGDSTLIVPDNELYVAGDHREGDYSWDSRSGLGTIPFYDIVGPASFRIWPINQLGGVK
jgi:signal peptidase I